MVSTIPSRGRATLFNYQKMKDSGNRLKDPCRRHLRESCLVRLVVVQPCIGVVSILLWALHLVVSRMTSPFFHLLEVRIMVVIISPQSLDGCCSSTPIQCRYLLLSFVQSPQHLFDFCKLCPVIHQSCVAVERCGSGGKRTVMKVTKFG